jgi:Zn-dependent M28 family amino/carboxypeptidase
MHFKKAVLVIFIITANFIAFAQPVISDSLLKAHVDALAHDSMKGRFTWRQEIKLAAAYIAGQMGAMGLKNIAGDENGFLIPWKPGRKKQSKGDHVVGLIPGSAQREKIIIFSAHYDHIGTKSSQKAMPFGTIKKFVKSDSIYNGANDNATGVAALLELARVFSEIQPSYTLMFVAFSGEELGLLGSADFMTNLKPSLVKMNANLEMLGRPNGERPFVIEEEGKTYVLRELNKHLQGSGANYPNDYFVVDPYPQQGLFMRSDNYSFHKKGIEAFTFMATDPEDEYYHSADDEVETIQFEQMGKIVQAIYWAMLPFVMDEK